MIRGVNIEFPFKPYPSQISMMNLIIKGIDAETHSLLESPTGSGKTLALLCSVLAWQKKRQEQPSESLSSGGDGGPGDKNATKMDKKSPKSLVTPKIYFGTRTHKQVAQIVSELKTTVYRDVKMSILSSRQYTCINPVNTSSNSSCNVNEGCKLLVKGVHPDDQGARCSFKQNARQLYPHSSLQRCGVRGAWDLEDLVKVGKRKGACPYFAARELASSASIVFCPYNYLVDPLIRSSCGINLKDQIVILDEAHNIEDSARAAASYVVNEGELLSCLEDMRMLMEKEFRVEALQAMTYVCTRVGSWMREQELREVEFERKTREWRGEEFVEVLKEWGVTEESLPTLLKQLQEASKREDEEELIGDDPEADDKEQNTSLSAASSAVLDGRLCLVVLF